MSHSQTSLDAQNPGRGLSLVALRLPRIISWQLCLDEETHSVMATAQMSEVVLGLSMTPDLGKTCSTNSKNPKTENPRVAPAWIGG